MRLVFGRGGLGDALLVIATSYHHLKSHIVFAPKPQIKSVAFRFLEAFGVSFHLVDFDDMEIQSYWANRAISLCHTPDDLNYYDWFNVEKYMGKIHTRLPVQALFGKNVYDKPVMVIAPAAADGGRITDQDGVVYLKYKSIKSEDFRFLVDYYLRDYLVFAIGSGQDQQKYQGPQHPNFRWVSFADGVQEVFRIINSSSVVLSADTWVKTYACMAGIRPVVFKHRVSNEDGGPIENLIWAEPGDTIFLNNKLWDLLHIEIEEYKKKLRFDVNVIDNASSGL